MIGHHQEKRDFDAYKRQLKKVAKDLRYGKEIVQLIEEAKTEGEAIRAMMKGRQSMPD